MWSGFFFQAEDGIRDLVRSRGLGDVYKRQHLDHADIGLDGAERIVLGSDAGLGQGVEEGGLADVGQADDAALEAHDDNLLEGCLLYTSDAADERSSVDLGGRRIIKKKKTEKDRE